MLTVVIFWKDIFNFWDIYFRLFQENLEDIKDLDWLRVVFFPSLLKNTFILIKMNSASFLHSIKQQNRLFMPSQLFSMEERENNFNKPKRHVVFRSQVLLRESHGKADAVQKDSNTSKHSPTVLCYKFIFTCFFLTMYSYVCWIAAMIHLDTFQSVTDLSLLSCYKSNVFMMTPLQTS